MSDHDQRTKAELSSEELDTLERMLLESARKAGLPQQRERSGQGGNHVSTGQNALSGDGFGLEGASARISLAGSTLELPSASDDDDAEPLSLRDLERVYEPGEPPPSLADTRPKSVPPPLPPARHPSAPPPSLEARDGENGLEAGRTSDSPALPHRASAPPPPPHRASAPPPPPHRASAPPPPPHRASAPPPPPRLALEVESLDANAERTATAEADPAASAIDAKLLTPVEPGEDEELEPGPDSARRDLQLLASVRPPPKGPDLEFDELMRIHVAPLAEDFPGASALPKDVLGPAAAAALTGGSVRPRPRAPLKSRPPIDDDVAAVSVAAAKIVSAAAQPIEADLVPPSFRDLAPPSAQASTPAEGAAPKKKKKKKKPAAAPGLDSSIAPTSSSLQPKVLVSPSGTPPKDLAKEGPTNRTPLYLAAAVVLLGGGYMLGKLGSSAQPTTAAQERPATARPAPGEVGAPPETPKASRPSIAAPTATATEIVAALEAGSPASTETVLPVPSGAPLVAAATTTAASTVSQPGENSATGASPGASPAAPTSNVAATATATALAPAETATTAPVTPPPAEAAFDKGAASAALASAAGQAGGCKQEGDPSGTARVQVTFVPSGRVTSANVQGPPYAGTATGGCIARAFRSASVPPFSGDPVTVSKTVSIP